VLLSIVTVNGALEGTVVSIDEVGVKFTSCQSLIKNPIVGASEGSTCGLITTVVSGTPGPSDEAFLQELEKDRIIIAGDMSRKILFITNFFL
jgi:predicted secreted protein